MKTYDNEQIKLNVAERFNMFLKENNKTAYEISKILYDNSNKTPYNVMSGKHLPGFDFIYLLKHHFNKLDLNWLIYGEKKETGVFNEPGVNYDTTGDIMLNENKKLISDKHAVINENIILKDKLLKCYETLIESGIDPHINSNKNSNKTG
jgi:hypothetical protein